MPPANVSSSVPLTQNTAAVLDFRCLFTPDLKKKQKKWQDGRLKFHAFNKRIMVYDDRANFVGDTHYHTTKLEEGEELELERGVLVEVGELIGKQDQDLGEILQSVQGAAKSARQASIAPERATGRGATPGPVVGRYNTPAPAERQMLMISSGPVRSLSALLGTPSGHHGRALMPTTSPFEDRQNRLASETPGPASKRRKVDSAPSVQPLWARTSLMQSGARGESCLPTNRAVARELSYPDSIAPKARVKKTFEKPCKAGYARKLTGATLHLSSTKERNAYNGGQPINLDTSDEENDDDVSVTGIKEGAISAPIVPPVKRRLAHILPPRKSTEIVYPESIAPKAKPRRTFEKPSKAGYADKLTGAALNLSRSNMTNVTKRQPSTRQPSAENDESEDDMDVTGGQERPRVETPILPLQLKLNPKPPAILSLSTPRQIVYPDSIASKEMPRTTFVKKSKAGHAEKLTGAEVNLFGAPTGSIKRRQPTKEEEDLLARLAELRAQREATEVAEMEELEQGVSAPKAKKARVCKAKSSSADKSHAHAKENEEDLFVDDDFVDIDAVVPWPAGKTTKSKKAKAPRKKQADVLPDHVEVNNTTIAAGSLEESEAGRAKSSSRPQARVIRKISQSRQSKNDDQQLNETPPTADSGTPQTSLSAITGSLRIKAKPKRTMLMLQSIPPKRTALSAATIPQRPAILPGASITANKQPSPEPSQATKALTEFHDKQNEKLQERRRNIESRKRVPIEINSSPEIEPQDDEAIHLPSSPIDLDEKEWVNPNATKASGVPGSAAPKELVEPTSVVTQQQPVAAPSSPQTTNRSKPYTIQEGGNEAQHDTEESAITYTNVDNLLRTQCPSSLFFGTATAPGGPLDTPAQGKTITPAPQSGSPQSSPTFTQAKERPKRRLSDLSASTKSSHDATKSMLRPPPVPLFNSTEDDALQSSLFVREESPEENDTHITKDPPLKGQQTLVQGLSDDDPLSQPIRAPIRVRAAAVQESRQSSPSWPFDDESASEDEGPSPPSKAIKARPVVDSSDSIAWPESQAEEGGFSSSPPPGPHYRELSAADEERLANGHSILVKIKSGIRSKEIIRPNSVNLIRNGDENPFIGFLRPPQPIVRSRIGSFVITEADEGLESEDGISEDDAMMDLEAQAEEKRQIARRREEAQKRTREFREKKERERLAKDQEAERLRLEDEARAEAARQKQKEETRLQDDQKKAQQLLERQERERSMQAEKKLVQAKKLKTRRREAEQERERAEKEQLGEQERLNAEGAQLEMLRLEAEAESRREFKERGAAEKAAKLQAESKWSAQLAKEAQEAQEAETGMQIEKEERDAKRKLDEQSHHNEMKLKLQQEIEIRMQEKYGAIEEKLRLKLEAQDARQRLEKVRQQKTEIQRCEDLRIKEQNEERQRQLDAKKMEDQRLADLREKEKRDAEQRKQKAAADEAQQHRAVETAGAKLANSVSDLPRSLAHSLQGFGADEAQAEKDRMSRQSEYQKCVNTSFGSVNGNTKIERIDISEGGSFGEGDLVLVQPKVTAFRMPAARSQAAVQPQPRRPSAASIPNRSFYGFPTHVHAAMHANGSTTASHDFAHTFQSTPPAVGYKVPSTLHLSAPIFKPFCKPKSVPIVPKKASRTMKEIRDEKRAERDQRQDLKILLGFEEKGEILSWETGAWTKEAGDLFGWRPKVGDEDDD